jgi:hypothetical protein
VIVQPRSYLGANAAKEWKGNIIDTGVFFADKNYFF